MSLEHAALVAHELSLPAKGVAATIALLDDGATVPFISRYRKEATGGLDDEAVSRIAAHLKVVEGRENRRAIILKSLAEQGVLTPALEKSVTVASTLAELEDLYLPFRPKRRTRAMTARERGLQPLADLVLAQSPSSLSREALAQPYLAADKKHEGLLLHLNPMTSVIVGYQRALLDGTGPEWGWLLYSAVFAIVMFVAGFAYFRHAKDSFEEAL